MSEPENRGRFAILRHDWPVLHFDLLLEAGDACRTWRLFSEPVAWPVAVERIADHRLHYLSYEGPVSGDRGSVKRWDFGTYIADGDAIYLDGERLQGRFRITADAMEPA